MNDECRRDHPASLRRVALLREDPTRVRLEGPGLALGDHSADHAAARPHAAHRRLPQDAGDADRSGHLLRHAVHPARARAAFPRTDALPGRDRGSVLGGDDARRSAVLPGQRRGHLRQPQALGPAAGVRRGSREALRRALRLRGDGGARSARQGPVARLRRLDRAPARRRPAVPARRRSVARRPLDVHRGVVPRERVPRRRGDYSPSSRSCAPGAGAFARSATASAPT